MNRVTIRLTDEQLALLRNTEGGIAATIRELLNEKFKLAPDNCRVFRFPDLFRDDGMFVEVCVPIPIVRDLQVRYPAGGDFNSRIQAIKYLRERMSTSAQMMSLRDAKGVVDVLWGLVDEV